MTSDVLMRFIWQGWKVHLLGPFVDPKASFCFRVSFFRSIIWWMQQSWMTSIPWFLFSIFSVMCQLQILVSWVETLLDWFGNGESTCWYYSSKVFPPLCCSSLIFGSLRTFLGFTKAVPGCTNLRYLFATESIEFISALFLFGKRLFVTSLLNRTLVQLVEVWGWQEFPVKC